MSEAARTALGLIQFLRLCKRNRKVRQYDELGNALSVFHRPLLVRIVVKRNNDLTAVIRIQNSHTVSRAQALFCGKSAPCENRAEPSLRDRKG